jgi:hypothetical protein
MAIVRRSVPGVRRAALRPVGRSSLEGQLAEARVLEAKSGPPARPRALRVDADLRVGRKRTAVTCCPAAESALTPYTSGRGAAASGSHPERHYSAEVMNASGGSQGDPVLGDRGLGGRSRRHGCPLGCECPKRVGHASRRGHVRPSSRLRAPPSDDSRASDRAGRSASSRARTPHLGLRDVGAGLEGLGGDAELRRSSEHLHRRIALAALRSSRCTGAQTPGAIGRVTWPHVPDERAVGAQSSRTPTSGNRRLLRDRWTCETVLADLVCTFVVTGSGGGDPTMKLRALL